MDLIVWGLCLKQIVNTKLKKNMKKVMLLLLLVTCWLMANGQRQPILLYGDYSPNEIERFAKGGSSKARQFAEIILLKTGETNLSVLFQNVFVKDTFLLEGSYKNSCWNTETGRIEFFLGKKFKGKVGIYNNGKFELVLYKGACANILEVKKKLLINSSIIGLNNEDLPYKPARIQPVVETPERNNRPVVVNNYTPQQNVDIVFKPTIIVNPTKKVELKIWKVVIPVGAMALAAIAILTKKGNTNIFINNPSREPTPGGPGGAPVTPPVVTPTVDPGGGPGGANTTR